MSTLPGPDDVERAAARLHGLALRTPVLGHEALDALAGCSLQFKCENLQRGGAFKFRGAANAVFGLDAATARHGVVTQSSGNHGAAIALACRLRGIPATVVVPEGAPQAKLRAIVENGATVVRCAPGQAARDDATRQLLAQSPATLVHPFDDARVIAGQGTAARELLEQAPQLDAVVAPVSGGGLLSGTLLAARAHGGPVEVVGAEPEGADDAARSLQAGTRLQGRPADTLCDGLRAELGALPFALLHGHVDVLLASDAEAVAAMRLLWERLKVVVEPSSALALAMILRHRERFAGRRVGVILSGGNVDLDTLPWQQTGARPVP